MSFVDRRFYYKKNQYTHATIVTTPVNVPHYIRVFVDTNVILTVYVSAFHKKVISTMSITIVMFIDGNDTIPYTKCVVLI